MSWYRDPTFDGACRIEAERARLSCLARDCDFRVAPVFVGDGVWCSRRKQLFDKCLVCDLRRID